MNLKLMILRCKEMGIIYCLTFPNGKKYIGQTKQPLKKRLKQHLKQTYCTAVHNAIKKYNEYKCEILLEVDNVHLDQHEAELIKQYNTLVPNGYNIREGGKSSQFCNETRKQMSVSHKGKKHSEGTKILIAKSLTGRKLSDETKSKISFTKKNSILSEESKARMNRKGMKHSEESKRKVSTFNKEKNVNLNIREKLSRSLRQNGKDLPLYLHRKEAKPDSYHGSGYIVRVPGFKSKSFISKKITDEEKYELALNYLKSITIR